MRLVGAGAEHRMVVLASRPRARCDRRRFIPSIDDVLRRIDVRLTAGAS